MEVILEVYLDEKDSSLLQQRNACDSFHTTTLKQLIAETSFTHHRNMNDTVQVYNSGQILVIRRLASVTFVPHCP